MFFFNIFKVRNFSLLKLKANSTGRSSGRISSNHRDSGSCLRISRGINFITPYDSLSVVLAVLTFKLKTGLILSVFESGFINLSISPANITVGSFIMQSLKPLPVYTGNSMPLSFIPVGSRVFNVDDIAKACGNSIQVLRHKIDKTLCKLPSRELKWLNSRFIATVGVISNGDAKFYKFYKAGQLRWSGRRPTVRGVAMNPIDHPHGGGQGKTSGGRPSVSPFAKLTKGYRTVRVKTKNRYIFKPRYAQHK